MSGAKILMIDDDQNLVSVFRTVCESKGYQFAAAFSAAEGLKMILQEKPDLIILDIIMEDFVAGFRVLSELRAGAPDSLFAPFRHVPILMLTSVTTKTNLDFSDRVGTALLPVDALMEKPAKPHEVLGRIEIMLRETASHRQG